MSADLAAPATQDTPAAEPSTLLGQTTPDPAPSGEAGTPPTDEQTPKSDAKVEGAPEKYEFTFPEGVALDQELASNFEPIARELNLSNAQAQKLADLYLAHSTKSAEQQAARWTETVKGWESTVKADKEVGGEKLESSLVAARSVIKRFGTPELIEAFGSSGMGAHPEMVRIFARIGRALGDDTLHNGAPAHVPKSAEQSLYPSMFNA